MLVSDAQVGVCGVWASLFLQMSVSAGWLPGSGDVVSSCGDFTNVCAVSPLIGVTASFKDGVVAFLLVMY